MKRINYSAILLATLFLAACQKDEQPAEFGSDANAVHIDATVGGSLFTRSNPMAPDVATQKTFNNGDRISIAADGQAAVVYAFDGTNWAPETSDQYLKWETNAMDFSAFYPVTTGTSLTAFTLPTDQSSETLIANADYMSLTQQLSKPAGGNTAELILERQMARIIVEIAGFGDQYTVQQHSVSNVRIFSAANAIGGSIPTAITPYVINGTGGTGSQGSSYTALIIPSAAQDAQDFITLTDGVGKTLSVKGIPAIEAGKSYTYTLTVGKDALTVGSVTVSDWTDGTAIPGGEAEQASSANPDTHTVELTKAGTLSNDLLTKAVNGGTMLIITGEMNTEDLALLKAYFRTTTTATDIDLSNSKFTSLPTEFLSGRSTITSVKLPEGLTTINNSAFKGCMGLTTIVLPESIETLGYDIFWNCTKLQGEINLPNVTEIGYQCFMNCAALESIKLPNLITANGSHIFYGCAKLSEIDFPNVTTIGTDYTFADCTNLKTVKLPKVQTVPQYAFNDCEKLSEVHLDIAQTFDKFAFGGCTSLTNVAFSKVQSIGESSFRGCTSLKTVNLPEVINIGKSAFFDCAVLESIDLPSATTIGDYAFQNCNKVVTMRLTTAKTFVISSMNNIFWSSSRTQTDLFLNSNKSSEITEGNKWSDVTWKSITTIN